ncbi:uncharacterized protein LOC105663054 [Megachile rotundata]|uniref:uncharacterized protein LOC105663054 n=1 Tax=Megachile rotundata TaxID=143995 RepID=UPI0006152FDF|nr:PREDICTED: uncharacterized protein LOC105663054 [Megachile rotundata]
MEWDNAMCLQLIEFYREHECLWDPGNGSYKSNNKKDEAWREIGKKMNCEVREVRKKMDSILASYRRERQKSLFSKSGRYGPYKSKWFAYKNMQFLLDKYRPRSTIKATMSNTIEVSDSRKTDDTNDTDAENSEGNEQETFSRREEFKPPLQRKQCKRKYESRRVQDPYKRRIVENVRDESTVFGEHVAMKHRKYSSYAKSTVEHLIANILYEADMGKYDDPLSIPTPSLQSKSPPSSSPTIHYPQSPSTSASNIKPILLTQSPQVQTTSKAHIAQSSNDDSLTLLINNFSEDDSKN